MRTVTIGGKGSETMKIKGAIFDMDGTLLDSMYLWETVGADYLVSRGITPEKGLREKLKVMSLAQAAEYYRRKYDITDDIDTIVKDVNCMIDHLYFDVVELKEGVVPFLEELKSDGVKMCVATATQRYMAEAALKRTGIFDYFIHTFTCAEVGFGKDSPVIFERALERLGTEKCNTLVFEDALYAIETAKDAGFTVVSVFDSSTEAQQKEIKKRSDYHIDSYRNCSFSQMQ